MEHDQRQNIFGFAVAAEEQTAVVGFERPRSNVRLAGTCGHNQT